MPEKEIENYFVKRCKEKNWLIFKFVSPGNAGVPDRLVIQPGGRMFFVELKAPKAKPRPLQEKVFSLLRANGAYVYVVDSKEKADIVLMAQELLSTNASPDMPMPCKKNMPQVTLKDWLLKLHEECDELEEAIFLGSDGVSLHNKLADVYFLNRHNLESIADEATDVIIVVTSLLEALGIGLEERMNALHRVNRHNRERGRW